MVIECKFQILDLQNKIDGFYGMRNKEKQYCELVNSQISKRLHEILKYGIPNVSFEEWNALRFLFDETIPTFCTSLINKVPSIRDEELRLCMLIRLGFRPKEMSVLLGVPMQNITNMRARLMQKYIGRANASAKDFDKILQEL